MVLKRSCCCGHIPNSAITDGRAIDKTRHRDLPTTRLRLCSQLPRTGCVNLPRLHGDEHVVQGGSTRWAMLYGNLRTNRGEPLRRCWWQGARRTTRARGDGPSHSVRPARCPSALRARASRRCRPLARAGCSSPRRKRALGCVKGARWRIAKRGRSSRRRLLRRPRCGSAC